MKRLKSFKELYEKASEAIQLVVLINDKDEEIESEGYYEPGIGIFDYDGNEYQCGIGVDGSKYTK